MALVVYAMLNDVRCAHHRMHVGCYVCVYALGLTQPCRDSISLTNISELIASSATPQGAFTTRPIHFYYPSF